MHQGDQRTEDTKPEIPVHTVSSPNDEEMFETQMARAQEAYDDVSANPEKQAQVLRDPILDSEIKKQKVFEKLVLFKEDHYKEVELAGISFKLRLLNAMDNSFIMREVRKEPTEDQISSLPLMILAAAIVDVNGVKLEEFYTGPDSIQDPTLRRYYELKQWAQPVVTILQAAFTSFREEIEKSYGNDFLDK